MKGIKETITINHLIQKREQIPVLPLEYMLLKNRKHSVLFDSSNGNGEQILMFVTDQGSCPKSC